MSSPVTSSTRMIVSGLAALALAGTLSACGTKNKDAGNQASNAAESASTPGQNDGATTDTDTNMTADMDEHHRQEMDHRDMRQGGSMMPDTVPATDAPGNSQAAPMKDM